MNQILSDGVTKEEKKAKNRGDVLSILVEEIELPKGGGIPPSSQYGSVVEAGRQAARIGIGFCLA